MNLTPKIVLAEVLVRFDEGLALDVAFERARSEYLISGYTPRDATRGCSAALSVLMTAIGSTDLSGWVEGRSRDDQAAALQSAIDAAG